MTSSAMAGPEFSSRLPSNAPASPTGWLACVISCQRQAAPDSASARAAGPGESSTEWFVARGKDVGEHTSFAARLSTRILQGMVDLDRRGEVEFSIPTSQADLRSAAFE